jgi:hypothetical protein
VFNAALILFGVICLQTLGNTDVGTKPAVELVVYLQSGLEALEIIGKETRLVRRCAKYLRKIIQISLLLGELIYADSILFKLIFYAVRDHVSAQQIPADASSLLRLLHDGNSSSIDNRSTQSLAGAEFGEFFLNEDYSFLDCWSDLV